MTRPSGAEPVIDAGHFVCPHCGVDANQVWQQLTPTNDTTPDAALKRATCTTCSSASYWVDGEMAWPRATMGEPAAEDLEGEMLELYNEAREVAPISPRSAAALLRLLVDKLVAHLGETDGTLDARIGQLAHKGEITTRTVNGLDAVRLTGNRALHAGQIDPEGGDDRTVVLLLFSIVNAIVENAITLPRRTAELVGERKRASTD